MNTEKIRKNIFTYITYSTFSKASITAVTQNNAFPIKIKSIFLEKYL